MADDKQIIFSMYKVSKTYPPNKTVINAPVSVIVIIRGLFIEYKTALSGVVIAPIIPLNKSQLKIGTELWYREPKKNSIILLEKNKKGRIVKLMPIDIFREFFTYCSICAISLYLDTFGNRTAFKDPISMEKM